MSVVDLRAPTAGDPAGLAALAAELRSAAAALVEVASGPEDPVRALRLAAGALDEAASALRELPRPVPDGSVEDVEARLARRLRRATETLGGSGDTRAANHETDQTQVV